MKNENKLKIRIVSEEEFGELTERYERAYKELEKVREELANTYTQKQIEGYMD